MKLRHKKGKDKRLLREGWKLEDIEYWREEKEEPEKLK